MMTLGWPSYLIHGTNKPYGVGMRSSHGCMRFYPEDIAELYDEIPVGTKVTVVNQPFVFGWHDDALYVQAFPVLEDDKREHPKAADTLLNAGDLRRDVAEGQAARRRDRPGAGERPRERHRAASRCRFRKAEDDARWHTSRSARHVENRVPDGANWNGNEEMLLHGRGIRGGPRDGTPLPKKPAPKATKKTATKPTGRSCSGGRRHCAYERARIAGRAIQAAGLQRR